MRLDNKVAVITGGCSGIGLATVELFVQEGARVMVADVQDEKGAALVARLGGRVAYQHCDVSSEAQIEALMQAAAARFDGIDVLFNNAGSPGAVETIEEMTGALWDLTHAVLLRGVALGIRHAVPHMKARGGAIVNTASIAAFTTGAAPIAYSAAKAGVVQLSRVAAAELARYNIRVNAICPGFVVTDIFTSGLRGLNLPQAVLDQVTDALRAAAPHSQPVRRAGSPEHVAQACLYLASDDSAFVTGTQLVVDGGVTIGPRSSWDPDMASPIRQLIDSAIAGAQPG